MQATRIFRRGVERPYRPSPDDVRRLEALRGGDEDAFRSLVDELTPGLMRVASIYAPDRTAAEEIVQDTWTGFLTGLDRFEGRASLKTWLSKILLNTARKRVARERRNIPFSAFEPIGDEPAVDADRFQSTGPTAGWWSEPPHSWGTIPEQKLIAAETRGRLADAIAGLPPSQREVITLRDVEGWTASEVCDLLGITESNQRVLLHRARSKVRRALENYLRDEDR